MTLRTSPAELVWSSGTTGRLSSCVSQLSIDYLTQNLSHLNSSEAAHFNLSEVQ